MIIWNNSSFVRLRRLLHSQIQFLFTFISKASQMDTPFDFVVVGSKYTVHPTRRRPSPVRY